MNSEKVRQIRTQLRNNAPERFDPRSLVGEHPLVVVDTKEEIRFYKYTQCDEMFHTIKLRPVDPNVKFNFTLIVRETWSGDSKFISLIEEFELDINEEGNIDLSVLKGKTVLAEIEEYRDGERTYFNVVKIKKYSPEMVA